MVYVLIEKWKKKKGVTTWKIRRFFKHWLSKNTTLLYHQMGWQTTYRWLWNWWMGWSDTKAYGSKCLGCFKAQSEYAFATWKKTIQQSARQQPFLLHLPEYTTITLVPVKVLILEIRKWRYFENGFNSMINFEFKCGLKRLEFIFSKVLCYSKRRVEGNSVLNYLSSHDDGGPLWR
jgi:alpha-amylase